jgi:hypothetical protein
VGTSDDRKPSSGPRKVIARRSVAFISLGRIGLKEHCGE